MVVGIGPVLLLVDGTGEVLGMTVVPSLLPAVEGTAEVAGTLELLDDRGLVCVVAFPDSEMVVVGGGVVSVVNFSVLVVGAVISVVKCSVMLVGGVVSVVKSSVVVVGAVVSVVKSSVVVVGAVVSVVKCSVVVGGAVVSSAISTRMVVTDAVALTVESSVDITVVGCTESKTGKQIFLSSYNIVIFEKWFSHNISREKL